jgi:hypothetical protein
MGACLSTGSDKSVACCCPDAGGPSKVRRGVIRTLYLDPKRGVGEIKIYRNHIIVEQAAALLKHYSNLPLTDQEARSMYLDLHDVRRQLARQQLTEREAAQADPDALDVPDNDIQHLRSAISRLGVPLICRGRYGHVCLVSW